MKLVNTLQGHEDDVVCVRWNAIHDQWVTSSADYTVRIWSGGGLNACLAVLRVNTPLCALSFDMRIGALLLGDGRSLRVVDAREFIVLQTHMLSSAAGVNSVSAEMGSTAEEQSQNAVDEVRDSILQVMHVPEQAVYLTSHADGAIRVWHEFHEHVNRSHAGSEQRGPGGAFEDPLRDVPVYTAVRGPELTA